MGSRCNNKIKQTCGDSVYDECVDYQGTVNTQSELVEETCLSIGQAVQDIYNQLEQIDVTDIDDCLDYPEGEDGKIDIKDVVKLQGQEICALKEKISELENRQLCDIPIGDCVDTFNCLVGECDNTIQTLGDWMKAVQIKICETL